MELSGLYDVVTAPRVVAQRLLEIDGGEGRTLTEVLRKLYIRLFRPKRSHDSFDPALRLRPLTRGRVNPARLRVPTPTSACCLNSEGSVGVVEAETD